MNKKYYIIIAILLVVLLIIIGMIGTKNLKSKKVTNTEDKHDQVKKTYTGSIKCEIVDKNDEIYETYFIENIEVEDNIVKTNETKRKIKYKNADTYNGFKENEEVLNPIYDDENLTVEYTFNEKYETPSEDMDVYIQNLTDNGYKCEKVMN